MDKNKILSLTGLAVFVILFAVLIWWLVTKNNKDSITPPAEVDAEWVAVGRDDSANKYINTMFSNNGKKWTRTEEGASFGDEGQGVAYGTYNDSQLWVALGDNNGGIGGHGYGNILYSSDGKKWTQTEEGASFGNWGNGAAYGTSDGNPANQLWVAVGDNNGGIGGRGYGNILYSSDGKKWTQTEEGASFNTEGFGVAYGTSIVCYG